MLRFIEEDKELQMIIAHELAHNIEGHIENQSTQKALEELGFHTEKLDVLGVYEANQFRFKNK